MGQGKSRSQDNISLSLSLGMHALYIYTHTHMQGIVALVEAMALDARIAPPDAAFHKNPTSPLFSRGRGSQGFVNSKNILFKMLPTKKI